MQRLVRAGVALFVEEILPLTHHAVTEIIEQQDLDRDVIGGQRLELAVVHPDAAVPVDIDHELVRIGDLRADGRW